MKVDKIIRFVCIVKGRLRFFFWFLFSFILLSFLTVILEKPVLATDYIGSVGRYKDPDPAPYCGIQKINFNNFSVSSPSSGSTYATEQFVSVSAAWIIENTNNNCDGSGVARKITHEAQVELNDGVHNPILTPLYGSVQWSDGLKSYESKPFSKSGSLQIPKDSSVWATGSNQRAGILSNVWVEGSGLANIFFANYINTYTPGGGGAITINKAEGRCDSYGNPIVHLEWTSTTGDSSYDIRRNDILYAEAVNSPWNSAAQNFNEQHSWVVRSRLDTNIQAERLVTTPSSCGGGVAVTITTAEGRCDGSNNPIVHLEWTSTTGDSKYAIKKINPSNGTEVGATEGTSPWDSGTQGFNETYTWVVRSELDSTIEDRESVTTRSSCAGGGNPDLTVSMSLNKSYYSPGETATATITIRNSGDGNAGGGFNTHFYYTNGWENLSTPDPVCPQEGNVDHHNDDLVSGATDTYYPTFTVPTSDGQYTARAFADVFCAISESNDSNNVGSRDYYVSSVTPEVGIQVFYDKDVNGLLDAGESFNDSGNSAFSSSIATVTLNGTSVSLDAYGTSGQDVTFGTQRARITTSAPWGPTNWSNQDAYYYPNVYGPYPYSSRTATSGTATASLLPPNDGIYFYLGINVPPPSTPANLSATPSCNGANSQITFSWRDSTGETGYWLDVSTDSNWASWGYISRPASSTTPVTFTWDSTTTLSTTNGGPTVIANNTPYYWRVQAVNAGGGSPHVYPYNKLIPPGDIGSNPPDSTKVPVVTLDCPLKPDLTVSAFAMPNGNLGQTVNASVTVRNNAGAVVPTGTTFEVSIKLDSSTMDCSSQKDATKTVTLTTPWAQNTNLAALTIPVTMRGTLGLSKTAVAMVDSQGTPPNCTIAETNETNNTRTDPYALYGFDLTVTGSLAGAPFTTVSPGDTLSGTLTVTNQAPPANMNSPATAVGVWPGLTSTESALPTCPSPPGSGSIPPSGVTYSTGYFTDGRSGNVPVLTVGTSTTITFSFTIPAGASEGSHNVSIYVIPSCTITPPDYEWNNNKIVNLPYTVKINSWFETTGGDVGSGGEISVSVNSALLLPTKRYQADYLAAAGAGLGDGSTSFLVTRPQPTTGWTIKNYSSHNLIPKDTTVYGYLAGKFRQKAIDSGSQVCNIPAGLPAGDHYYYCLGDAGFHAGNGPNGNNVFFIDGNLVIDGDLTLALGDTAVFIVGGNITINKKVRVADGIFIAKGIFNDAGEDGAADVLGLTINGAVYATTVNLARVLGGTGVCSASPLPVECDNTKTPAEIINFVPKYLVVLASKDLLGSQPVSWKEVAP